MMLTDFDLTEPKEAPSAGADNVVSYFDRLMDANITNADTIAARKKLARDARFVLPEIALEGQATIIYAAPGTGKTLLILWLIVNAENRAGDIIYLNADDTFQGATTKAELMCEHGVKMIVPGQHGFEASDLDPLIREMVKSGKSQSTTLVLDTLKKFVSLMDKKEAANFGKLARHFVEGGGTIISLAHANKHKGADGKSIYEGVGDFVSDFDAAYIIDLDTPKDQADRQVTFRNEKMRGPNSMKVSFRYNAAEAVSWIDRFNSVQHVNTGQAKALVEEQQAAAQYADDLACIEYLRHRLQHGALTHKALTQEGLGNGFSRGHRDEVLNRYNEDNPRSEMRIFNRTPTFPHGYKYELA